MNKQYQITISSIDNGWMIRANGDKPGAKHVSAAALSREDLISQLKDIADHIFDEPTPKTMPPKPQP